MSLLCRFHVISTSCSCVFGKSCWCHFYVVFKSWSSHFHDMKMRRKMENEMTIAWRHENDMKMTWKRHGNDMATTSMVDLRVGLMSSPCHFHVIFIDHLIFHFSSHLHVMKMRWPWFKNGVKMTWKRHGNDINGWLACWFDVVPMSFPCHCHAVFISASCHFHVGCCIYVTASKEAEVLKTLSFETIVGKKNSQN